MSSMDGIMREIRLHSWFPEPIPENTDLEVWSGRVRIWGRLETTAAHDQANNNNTAKDGEETRYWRTSSITDRLSSTELVTHYGTHVTLLGPIASQLARRVNLSLRLIGVFRNGFPFSWEQRIARESHPFFAKYAGRIVSPAECKSEQPRHQTNPTKETGKKQIVTRSRKRARTESPKPIQRRASKRLRLQNLSLSPSPSPPSQYRRIRKHKASSDDVVAAQSVLAQRLRRSMPLSTSAQKPRRSLPPKKKPAQKPRRSLQTKQPTATRRSLPSRQTPQARPSLPLKQSTEASCALPGKQTEEARRSLPPKQPTQERRSLPSRSAKQRRSLPSKQPVKVRHELLQKQPERVCDPLVPRPPAQDPSAIAPKLKKAIPSKKKAIIAAAQEQKPPKPQPLLLNQDSLLTNNSDEKAVEVPGAGAWTEKQRDAFERQCNIIGANDKRYFEKIALGVEGKTASECRALLEATWASPTGKKIVSVRRPPPLLDIKQQTATKKRRESGNGSTKKKVSIWPPVSVKGTPMKRKPLNALNGNDNSLTATPDAKSSGGTTPEIVMHVRHASKTKRGRDTAKYRHNVRHLANVVARDISDDVVEPTIATPDAAASLISRIRQSTGGDLMPFSEMDDGTPGTEVRNKRAQAEFSAQVATPEILARGKSIGFKTADSYVATFKRRTGSAAPAVPKFSQDQPSSRVPIQGAGKGRRRVSFVNVTFDAKNEDENDSDDEGGSVCEDDDYLEI